MIKILVLMIASISIIFSESAMHNMHSNSDSNKYINQRILDSMHDPMKGISNSKNIEIDFLKDMIPHHQGAINSSRIYLDNGKNDKLKEIARNIISSQEEEIRYFVELLESLPKNISKDYVAYHSKAKQAMDDMMKDMHKIKASGNIDADFIKAMIIHHTGAIRSATDVLAHTTNEKIKEIANNIIQVQDKEIKNMEDILKSL